MRVCGDVSSRSSSSCAPGSSVSSLPVGCAGPASMPRSPVTSRRISRGFGYSPAPPPPPPNTALNAFATAPPLSLFFRPAASFLRSVSSSFAISSSPWSLSARFKSSSASSHRCIATLARPLRNHPFTHIGSSARALLQYHSHVAWSPRLDAAKPALRIVALSKTWFSLPSPIPASAKPRHALEPYRSASFKCGSFPIGSRSLGGSHSGISTFERSRGAKGAVRRRIATSYARRAAL
mmetsp:Transcript_7256/g.29429  ORF Transcript_7256/g.29429 Transcript_7256/m.29429 type:complete len:237 (+) Transcript_7256:461-1171(+)